MTLLRPFFAFVTTCLLTPMADAGWRLIGYSTTHTFVNKRDSSLLPPGGASASASLATSGSVTIADGKAFDHTLWKSMHLNVTGVGVTTQIWKWSKEPDPALDSYAEFKIRAMAEGKAIVTEPAGSASTNGYTEVKVRCGDEYIARVDWSIAQSSTGGVSIGGAGAGGAASAVAGGSGMIGAGNPHQPTEVDENWGDECGSDKYIQTQRSKCSLSVDANGGLFGPARSKAELRATSEIVQRDLGSIDCMGG